MNWRKNFTYPLINKYQKSTEPYHLNELRKSQYLSPDKLQEIQNKKLKILLNNSYDNVPYYKNIFDSNNLKSYKIDSIQDITKIPVLSRNVVQEQFEKLISKKNSNLIQTTSGGSTGDPVKILYSVSTIHRRNAAAKRHDEWAGFHIGEKQSIIWGARKDFKKLSMKNKIWNFLINNHIVLDSSSFSDEETDKFLRRLNKFKPKCILGYAQSLVYLADYINATNSKIHFPGSIISSAELLTKHNRELIENTFQAPVYDRYGARETSVIASECEYHNMHVRDEDILLEVLREDGSNCNIGEEGEIVLTDLTNLDFPLIRYKIGDLGIKTYNNCRCGRSLSTIKILSGRTTDFILTPLKRKVSGVAALGYICSDLTGLSKVQFHQKHFNKVILRLIPNNKFNMKSIKILEQRIRKFLDDIEPEIKIVNKIDVTTTGKFRVVVSEIL